MSWIWLDGIEAFEKSRGVRAWKKWESQFPSAYLIELIAQAAGLLLGAESRFQDDIVFTKIEGVRFTGPPQQGKRLEVEVEADNLRREGGWFHGRILQDGNPITEGRVLLMNVGRLRPDGKGPITFPAPLVEALKGSLA